MRIERDIVKQLKAWKEAPVRKPVLLKGARQIGKTFIIRQFGMNNYKNFIEINFEESPELRTAFELE